MSSLSLKFLKLGQEEGVVVERTSTVGGRWGWTTLPNLSLLLYVFGAVGQTPEAGTGFCSIPCPLTHTVTAAWLVTGECMSV